MGPVFFGLAAKNTDGAVDNLGIDKVRWQV